LWSIEPSGEVNGFKANASGKGKQVAKTQLEKLDFSTLAMEDAVIEAAKMYQVFTTSYNN
jgi:20S proteasome subunit alpha 7